MPHTYITRMNSEEFLRLFEDHGIPHTEWLDRGIDPDVATARPYEPWSRNDIEPVKRAHASVERKGQKLAISRKVQDEFADWEREQITERTRNGKLEKTRQGKVLPSRQAHMCFIYHEGIYEVDESRMAQVRRMFRMVGVEGATLRDVK